MQLVHELLSFSLLLFGTLFCLSLILHTEHALPFLILGFFSFLLLFCQHFVVYLFFQSLLFLNSFLLGLLLFLFLFSLLFGVQMLLQSLFPSLPLSHFLLFSKFLTHVNNSPRLFLFVLLLGGGLFLFSHRSPRGSSCCFLFRLSRHIDENWSL